MASKHMLDGLIKWSTRESWAGRKPSIRTETLDQIMASREAAMPNQLDMPEEQQRAIVHDYMGGRIKVVEWLKIMENQTAKSATANSPMAHYDFAWLWTELGLSERRE